MGDIDPRFTVEATLQGTLVDPLSAYMTAVRIGNVFVNRGRGSLDSVEAWDFDGPPPPLKGAEIILMANGAHVPRQYGLWGVQRAIEYLAKHSFQSTRFRLHFEDRLVGSVIINTKRDRTSAHGLPLQPGDVDGNLTFPISVVNNTNLDIKHTEQAVRVTFTPGGQKLSFSGFFYPMILALNKAFATGADTLVTTDQFSAPSFSTRLTTAAARPQRRPPNSYDYSSFSDALWATAMHAWSKSRFGEYEALVIKDRRYVGKINEIFVGPESAASHQATDVGPVPTS